MEVFKSVFFYRDGPVDVYLVMKEGECALRRSRMVSFYDMQKKIKPIYYGDCVEFTVGILERSEHIVPKFYAKLESSPQERKENLFKTAKIYLNNAHTTKREIDPINTPKVKNCYFFEQYYFEVILTILDSISKFYRQNKNYKIAKFAKQMYNEFLENRPNTLGRMPEDDSSVLNFPKYVKRIKKKYFSMFTRTQKVIDGIHELIKNDAFDKLNKIVEFEKKLETN